MDHPQLLHLLKWWFPTATLAALAAALWSIFNLQTFLRIYCVLCSLVLVWIIWALCHCLYIYCILVLRYCFTFCITFSLIVVVVNLHVVAHFLLRLWFGATVLNRLPENFNVFSERPTTTVVPLWSSHLWFWVKWLGLYWIELTWNFILHIYVHFNNFNVYLAPYCAKISMGPFQCVTFGLKTKLTLTILLSWSDLS